MKIKLDSLKVDITAEREGAFVDCALLPGIRFKVRSVNYGPYQAAVSKAAMALSKKYPAGSPPEDEIALVEGSMIAEHLLLGWEGIEDAFTEAGAKAALIEPAFRNLRAGALWCAARVGARDIEFVEEAAKK
jgi:hypothetical protein